MTIYDDLKPVATELLVDFKQGVITLTQITPGTGPADNPGASTPTVYPLSGTVKGVSFQYVRDGFAVATDLMVTTAVNDDVVPTEKDFIDIDGVRYKIIKDMSVPAAGTKIAWKFIVRKGG